MRIWEILVLAGGVLHFTLLAAGALVPFKLNFRAELKKVNPMLRELVWVYYIFIAITIIGFGVLSVTLPGILTSGAPLARAVCAFIAVFWATRLAIQLFIFDARPYLTSWALRWGYHMLTFVFAYHTIVYGLVAVAA